MRRKPLWSDWRRSPAWEPRNSRAVSKRSTTAPSRSTSNSAAWARRSTCWPAPTCPSARSPRPWATPPPAALRSCSGRAQGYCQASFGKSDAGDETSKRNWRQPPIKGLAASSSFPDFPHLHFTACSHHRFYVCQILGVPLLLPQTPDNMLHRCGPRQILLSPSRCIELCLWEHLPWWTGHAGKQSIISMVEPHFPAGHQHTCGAHDGSPTLRCAARRRPGQRWTTFVLLPFSASTTALNTLPSRSAARMTTISSTILPPDCKMRDPFRRMLIRKHQKWIKTADKQVLLKERSWFHDWESWAFFLFFLAFFYSHSNFSFMILN